MTTSPPTRYETRLNYVTIALFAGLVMLTVYGVLTLPNRIPVHFNLSGEADRWGSSTSLLILPFLCLFMEAILWATRWAPPELMNFPGPRTPDNVARQMLNIMHMLATIRAFMASLFVVVTGQWVWAAISAEPHLTTTWLILFFIGTLLISTGVFVIRAYRMADRS